MNTPNQRINSSNKLMGVGVFRLLLCFSFDYNASIFFNPPKQFSPEYVM